MQSVMEMPRETATANAPSTAAHPYLSGVHSPMTEELDITDLPVTGTIPPGLDGNYLRIGPNPLEADPQRYHWFTGDGMIHGLAISGGKALWYKNRSIRSNHVAAVKGIEPAPGPRHHNDTVNTNVVAIGGQTYALVEAGSYPVALSKDLEQQTYDNFGGTLAGAFTAHPHLDPLTGENHAITYEGFEPGKFTHVVVDAAGKVIREEPISLPHAPMMHDSAITQRYAIIFDFPVAFSMEALAKRHSFPYNWQPQLPSRIGLLPRNGTQADIIWCPVEPSFAFHSVNAYDRPDGKVELDLCVYDSMFHEGANGPDARSRNRGMERWTIDPETRSVAIRTIDAAPQEFPRLDERLTGQPYRYAYALAMPADPSNKFLEESRLYRHDLQEGTRQVHDFGAGRLPGEFVFVPKSADSPEEAGWMVGLVIDMANEKTDLVIIDAERFEDAPVAIVHLPHRVPPGFHGNWIAAASLKDAEG